ncbi:MAG TPA: hypothetical protein VND90_13625 [Terracidiphilus sp.]|nr:hypothetical protein [Terracidiphilus sp.]
MIQTLYLGRVSYDEALQLQAEIAALRLEGRVGNVLLLLEHPPVLTLGRNADRSNILASDQLLASRGVTLHNINRGGDVTYHGPGQLVGYPIFDLRSLQKDLSAVSNHVSSSLGPAGGPTGARIGPVDFVRRMEEALIRLCGVYGLRAFRIAGLTGVWCGPVNDLDRPQNSSKELPSAGPRKIAAIGIHVSRGITTHGFAFNLTTDLRDFQLIHPCGITDKPVTSLAAELASPALAREGGSPAALPTLEAFAHQAARQFGLVFGQQVLAVENLETLRAQASLSSAPKAQPAAPQVPPKAQRAAPEVPPKAQPAAPEVPPKAQPAAPQVPQDTPLEFPRELERFHGRAQRPVRA